MREETWGSEKVLCELRSVGRVLSCGYKCMHRGCARESVCKAGNVGRHGMMEGGCRSCGNRGLGDLRGTEAGAGVRRLSFLRVRLLRVK